MISGQSEIGLCTAGDLILFGTRLVTVQSNYNFTHALYLTRGARMFQRGQRNNHACTYKFTRLQIKHA